MLTDKCLELLSEEPMESTGSGSMINSRAKAVKGLVELVRGDLYSGKAMLSFVSMFLR